MNRKFLFIVAIMGLAVAVRASDEIVLKSGRTMTGRITAETDKSYTIKLGTNMFLSVAKEEVASVSREKPAPSRPTVRLEHVTSTEAVPSPTAASKNPGKSPSPVVSSGKRPAGQPSPAGAPAPKNGALKSEALKIGVTIVQKSIFSTTYDVDGRDFESAQRAVLDPSSGKGFLVDHERRAGHTTWQVSWTGVPATGGKQWKSVVVTATMTTTLPRWKGAERAAAAEADKWNTFLQDASEHEAGHLAIINDSLISFGQSVSNLNDASEKELRSETTALFKAIQDQTAKRRQGYERREKRPIIPIRKKPAPKKP